MQRSSAARPTPADRPRLRSGSLAAAWTVASTVLAVRVGLTLFGLERVRRDLLPVVAPSDSNVWAARRVGQAVLMVSRLVPFASCLTQAQACQVLLARRGIASTLCLGVRSGRSKALLAHAWLRCGNDVVTGATGVDVSSFRLLAELEAQRSWQR